jgi:hypothetical protein
MLASARVLADSFLRRHPDVPFYVLLADEVGGCFEPARERFRLLLPADLRLASFPRWRFRYTANELSYALTPALLAHLLDLGYGGAIFLKQESLVTGDLAPVFDLLRENAILLTPHLLAPLTGADAAARELNILLSGVYNGGFLGISESASARRFLSWWQDRLACHCYHAVDLGMHFEQRWLDLVPGFFDGVHLMRDPGMNVAHWNLPERNVRLQGDDILVNDAPCRLFRFSGFEPERPDAATKYSPRLPVSNLGPAGAVYRRYAALLEEAGYRETAAWPYAYDHFDDGVPIPAIARRLYRELGDAADRFGDPRVRNAPDSFFHWLNEPVDGEPNPSRAVTRFWDGIYRQRADVQKAFPKYLGAHRRRFLRWTARYGIREHSVPECFLARKTK